MTIRKGEPWGVPSDLPEGAVVCADDRAVAAAAAAVPNATGTTPSGGVRPDTVVALTGGDLFRTLGGQPGPPRWSTGGAMAFPIDVLVVELDGRKELAVAHVVVREGRWWVGPTLVAMNAAFVGAWYLGPRAHPNDGRVDVTEGRLPFGQRRRGRSRMPSGAHVPHPELTEVRVSSLERTLPSPRRVWLDGVARGTVSTLRIRVVPDAITAIV